MVQRSVSAFGCTSTSVCNLSDCFTHASIPLIFSLYTDRMTGSHLKQLDWLVLELPSDF